MSRSAAKPHQRDSSHCAAAIRSLHPLQTGLGLTHIGGRLLQLLRNFGEFGHRSHLALVGQKSRRGLLRTLVPLFEVIVLLVAAFDEQTWTSRTSAASAAKATAGPAATIRLTAAMDNNRETMISSVAECSTALTRLSMPRATSERRRRSRYSSRSITASERLRDVLALALLSVLRRDVQSSKTQPALDHEHFAMHRHDDRAVLPPLPPEASTQRRPALSLRSPHREAPAHRRCDVHGGRRERNRRSIRRRLWTSSLSSTTGIVSPMSDSVRLSSIMMRLEVQTGPPDWRAGSSHQGASANLLFGALNSLFLRVFDLHLGAPNGIGNMLRALLRLLADSDFLNHPCSLAMTGSSTGLRPR